MTRIILCIMNLRGVLIYITEFRCVWETKCHPTPQWEPPAPPLMSISHIHLTLPGPPLLSYLPFTPCFTLPQLDVSHHDIIFISSLLSYPNPKNHFPPNILLLCALPWRTQSGRGDGVGKYVALRRGKFWMCWWLLYVDLSCSPVAVLVPRVFLLGIICTSSKVFPNRLVFLPAT